MRFSTRLFFSLLSLVAFTCALGGNLLLYSSFSAARARRTEDAVRSFRMLQYAASAVAASDSVAQLVELLPTLLEENDAALRLTQDGETLYDSVGGEASADYFGAIPDAPDATELRRMIFTHQGVHYLRLTGLLKVTGRELVLEGVFNVEEAYAALHLQQRLYRAAYCVSLCLGAILAWMLTRLLTNRSRRSARPRAASPRAITPAVRMIRARMSLHLWQGTSTTWRTSWRQRSKHSRTPCAGRRSSPAPSPMK